MKFILILVKVFIMVFGFDVKMILGSWSKEEELNDLNLTVPEIIQKYGYPAETHTTVSEDGYNLMLHRIPHGKNSNSTGFPILVMHGLSADSSCFLLLGRRSLGFFLADKGYDVWLGNIRGNDYTRSHKYLSPKDARFWDFSWHEYGVYDLPAYINYVTNYTGNRDILYSGHSMGCTAFLVMASERPEYQKKIRGAVFMGPASTVKYLKSPVRVIAPFEKIFQTLSIMITKGEINVRSPEYKKFVMELSKYHFIEEHVFKNLLFLFYGFDYTGFEERAMPNLLNHLPSAHSAKSVTHYCQLMNSGKFRQYDYGFTGNMIKYNQPSPPKYELERITIPISIFYGANDLFATPKDIKKTLSHLPAVKSISLVPRKDFTHIDFLMASDAVEILYRNVAQSLKHFMIHGGVKTNDHYIYN